MASIWDIIKIKSIAGIEKVTDEQKNSTISNAVSKWTEMGLSQQQIAYGIAVMGVESAFNPNAKSPTGPYGLGQFSADTWKDAVKEYNTKYGGNLDPIQSKTDPAAQIAVLGAWTAKVWATAQDYVKNPMLKGYSIEEIAYALHHQSAYSAPKQVKEFLLKSGFNGYNNPNIKGYFLVTNQIANTILDTFYPIAIWGIPYDLERIKFYQQFFHLAVGTGAKITRRDPLILDLDGDGIETTNVTDGAYFDHDSNGFSEQTGWVNSDDGLLVLDRNNDGIINDGKELFGDQTILSNGQKASNGFQALAELDSNADGKIDANDAAFNQLRIWQDIDGDGYSTADELLTLEEAGIQSINLQSEISTVTDPEGNTQTRTGSFEKIDGTTGTIGEYTLRRDTAYTIATEWLDVPEEERRLAVA